MPRNEDSSFCSPVQTHSNQLTYDNVQQPAHRGNSVTADDTVGERPYRSHLRPACHECRRRKSRCKVDDGEEKGCLMCRVHGTKCEFPAASSRSLASPRPSRRSGHGDARGKGGVASSRARGVQARVESTGTSTLPTEHHILAAGPAVIPALRPPDSRGTSGISQPSTTLLPGLGSPGEEESSHIVGPVVTNDTQILANYLRADPSHGSGRLARPGLTGGDSNKPVLFARVSKRPVGQTPNQTLASVKCQIIEKIVEPWTDELVDLYFQTPNRCFPVLEERSFREQYRHQRDQISPALLAHVYAHAIVYWSQACRAAGRPCPDSRFIWNQASDALYSELQLSPGTSSVVSVLLNVGGRPSCSMIGNGVLIGSAVSIAHGLGLHRDPSDWDIAESEKRLRIDIWWALVVHDKWFSLAYGTPPHIYVQGGFHDVPKPTHHDDRHGMLMALIGLSEVLDVYLVHLHDLRTPRRAMSTFNPEGVLSRWEESLSGDARRLILRGTDLNIPGASNLRLSYLFVRLLQRRIELDNGRHNGDQPDTGSLLNRYIHIRRAAEDIVLLVQELKSPQLNDFWLPTAAFIFTSTIAFLLRVALETEETAGGLAESLSLRLAKDLLDALQAHQQHANWELGDICIAQYAEVVEKLRKAPPISVGQEVPEDSVPDFQDFVIANLPDAEELFPNLWDMFDSGY
ncbi:hypothetical protein VP1G_08434 [Cytospora mali]|uniref:Zn(2)-C6 fungal-type domain-containing protein n=1 Tax=Cytospora mali TaxID=578113 RepID=A0A194VBV6_CYTMA|nr:hypothetical protein VP1G_08434 [Valsa mali var. pyri (nom. inval.)]